MSIKFGTLKIENGKAVETEIKIMNQSTIAACPNVIFDPKHYHDGTCDCFDETKSHMKKLGYKWNKKTNHWSG